MLEKVGQATMLKMFPTRCTESTLHSGNTWSTMVKSKVHSAWRLKRLVKQPSWRCFLLVVLNRLGIVLTPEAQWWRARYTQLDAWNAWSSNQLENVSYSLYWTTWHSVNTWSTLVKSKVHEAWCLKRLVKRTSCKCFLLIILNRLCTVVTLEAQWWRARYTQLDAWNAWSSSHLEDVSYSLY